MEMTGLNLGENCSSQYFVYLLDGVYANDTFAPSPLLRKLRRWNRSSIGMDNAIPQASASVTGFY